MNCRDAVATIQRYYIIIHKKPYKRVVRPIFPLDKEMQTPALEVVFL
ncbi:MAG: hypothetical protein R3Y59_05745 [bacterium]